VVIHAPSGTLAAPAAQQTIAATTAALKAVPGVSAVGDLLTSPNGATAYLTVRFDQPASAFAPADRAPYDAVVAAGAPAEQAGLEVAFGGKFVSVYSTGTNWISDHADLIGIGIAIVLLLLAFGSVVGMLLPIATALLGVAVATNAVLLLTFVTDVSSI